MSASLSTDPAAAADQEHAITSTSGRAVYSQISRLEGPHVFVRDRELTSEFMGHLTFTQMIYLTLTGRDADADQARVLDAVLVSLVDHGVTGSSLAARMTYRSAPDALQAAVAAGLLNAGGRVLGSMEGCGRLLSEHAPGTNDPADVASAASQAVASYRSAGRRIPGLGHNLHEDGDLRATRLFDIAQEAGHRGRYVALLEQVARQAGEAAGKQLPINVTGAVAAVLLEIGIEWQMLRGFGLMSRVVGLVAHVAEERRTGTVDALIRRLQHEETTAAPSTGTTGG
jgi:citrate synthase